MIHEVEGDILLTEAEVVAHGVAPNDDFKVGVAASLRQQWPAMYKDFRHFCHQQHPKEGTTWSWGGPGHARIVALFTQETAADRGGHPGRATLPNVNHALKALRHNIEEEGYSSVAITRIATGVGGLEWRDVKPYVEQHLGDLGIPVYVYSTFHAGMHAEEPVA